MVLLYPETPYRMKLLKLLPCTALLAVLPVTAQDADFTDDVSDNPLMFRLFMPMALYNSVLDGSMLMKGTDATTPRDTTLFNIRPLDSGGHQADEAINSALLKLYLEHPELVRQTENDIKGVRSIVPASQLTASQLYFQPVRGISRIEIDENAIKIRRIKPSYWKTFGNFQGKYTQTYFSNNWYKGGQNNQTVLASTSTSANYAKGGTTWDNMLEMRLGFIATRQEDDSRDIRTNEDLLRITSKFGLKAHNAWYYSAQIQGYTQFLPFYDTKDPTKLKSKFMAPAVGNLSLGLDYKPKFRKQDMSLSVQVSPFSYNCKYVSVDSIAPNYGIEKGRNYTYSMGSRFEANFNITFWKDFTLTSKASFYTSFHNVESNLENTLDYRLSRYFSLQIFSHLRFDDSVLRDPDWNYYQYKELLTFNFNYKW